MNNLDSGEVKPFVGRFDLLIPKPSEGDYGRLYRSIKAFGVMVPIRVLPSGEIIDGHTRFEIANKLEIECPFEVTDDTENAVEHALTLNMSRRHLTDVQKMLLAQRIEAQLIKLMQAAVDETGSEMVADMRSRLSDMVGLKRESYVRNRTILNELLRRAPKIRSYLESGEVSMVDVRRFLDTCPFLLPYYELGALDGSQLKLACQLFAEHYDYYPMLIDAMLNPSERRLLEPAGVGEFIRELSLGDDLEDVDIISGVINGEILLQDAPEILRNIRLERHQDSQIEIVIGACKSLSRLDTSTLTTVPAAIQPMIIKSINVLRKALP